MMTDDFYNLDAELMELAEEATLQLIREICQESFYEFVKIVWPLVFPEEFVDGPHIEAICLHLQALAEDIFDNLIINVPPGHGKSRIASVLFPAWCMGPRNMRNQWLCTALAAKLSIRDCEAQRDIMQLPVFQQLWPHLKFKSEGATAWKLVNGAKRDTTSKGARATGLRGHYRIVDDLHDLSDSKEEIEKGVVWYNTTWSSRDNFGTKPPKEVLIMQRVGPADVTGHLLTTEPEHWVHLCLPLEYNPERHCKTPIWEDWRTKKGELLWPAAYNDAWVRRKKAKVGPKNWDTQYNQRPHAEGGTEFREEWLGHRFSTLLACNVEMWIISVDSAFKDKETSDFCVFQLWAKSGAFYYCVAQIRGKWNYPTMKRKLVEFREAWKAVGIWPDRVVIEDKANGTALIDELMSEVEGIVRFEPKDGKIVRWRATTGQWEAGQVKLPVRMARVINKKGQVIYLQTGWVHDFVQEHLEVPDTAVNDDQVDAAAQAILAFRQIWGTQVVAQAVGEACSIFDDEREDHGYGDFGYTLAA